MEVERRNLFGRGTRRFLVKVLCDTSLGPATDSWDSPRMFIPKGELLPVAEARITACNPLKYTQFCCGKVPKRTAVAVSTSVERNAAPRAAADPLWEYPP